MLCTPISGRYRRPNGVPPVNQPRRSPGQVGQRPRCRAASADRAVGHSGPEQSRWSSILAHYLADACDQHADEIRWDEADLAESSLVDDDDLRAIHPTLHVAGFLSSLHLNLADGYRRLGRFEDSEAHLAASRNSNQALGAQSPEQVAYRQMIVAAQDYVADKIAARDSAAPSYTKRVGQASA